MDPLVIHFLVTVVFPHSVAVIRVEILSEAINEFKSRRKLSRPLNSHLQANKRSDNSKKCLDSR